ncbi:hypothetical protein E2C01_063108 [Portunus trituberculatus]|uniref:Uncharacterized protein n=1 Tax=Portunus trituberculatus TaxID=210409 RepID=A0A5B7HG07_PORTR|nr:hypothetical protein [Portunus trituberculatus]
MQMTLITLRHLKRKGHYRADPTVSATLAQKTQESRSPVRPFLFSPVKEGHSAVKTIVMDVLCPSRRGPATSLAATALLQYRKIECFGSERGIQEAKKRCFSWTVEEAEGGVGRKGLGRIKGLEKGAPEEDWQRGKD